MAKKYIDEKEFCDFKQNFHILINTFNHSITDIKDEMVANRNNLTKLVQVVSEIKGQLKVTSRLVWWIAGIISTLVAAGILASK